MEAFIKIYYGQELDLSEQQVVSCNPWGDGCGGGTAHVSDPDAAPDATAEVDAAVDALTAAIEPVMIVLMGTMVGGMLVAMYLPMFKMSSVVG